MLQKRSGVTLITTNESIGHTNQDDDHHLEEHANSRCPERRNPFRCHPELGQKVRGVQKWDAFRDQNAKNEGDEADET